MASYFARKNENLSQKETAMISDLVQRQMENWSHLCHLQKHEKLIPRGRERQMYPHFLISQISFLYGIHNILLIFTAFSMLFFSNILLPTLSECQRKIWFTMSDSPASLVLFLYCATYIDLNLWSRFLSSFVNYFHSSCGERETVDLFFQHWASSFKLKNCIYQVL